MPKFVNSSNRPLTVIVNGRKVPVPPGVEIDGPDHLSMYKQLKRVSEQAKINVNKSNKPKVKPKKENVVATKVAKPGPPKVRKTPKRVKDDYKNKPIDFKSEVAHIFKFNLKNAIADAKNYINSYDMNKKPSVGICILTKNSYDLINDCVESIFRQVKYSNTKIYIFDTGTTDKKVLKRYDYWKRNSKLPIQIINVGSFQFSENYNKGISKVDTDFVVIQNNDTLALNDYVSKVMRLMFLEKIGIAGPRMLFKDMRIQHDGQFIYDHPNKKFINPGHVNYGVPDRQAPKGRKRVDGITAAGMFVRTSLFKKFGGFNINYLDIYQDVEFNIEARMMGYTIMCDMDARIHHYDNSSRKGLWKDKKQISKMWKDSNYLHKKIRDGELFYQPRKRYKFSIVTLVSDKDQYFDFLNDLQKQEDYPSFEVIPIPNFNNEYCGCSEALNIGLDAADSEFTILCHQDLKVPTNWLKKIEDHINVLGNKKWGVLGMAGSVFNNSVNTGATYLNSPIDPRGTTTWADSSRKSHGPRLPVQCLDELCMIVKTNMPIRFDEKTFDHYHLYGSDFCLQYLAAGYQNYAIDAPCVHLSDGYSNLKNPKHREKYMKDIRKLNQKWKTKFPKYRNMTAAFDNVRKEARLYVADNLIAEGFKWDKVIHI